MDTPDEERELFDHFTCNHMKYIYVSFGQFNFITKLQLLLCCCICKTTMQNAITFMKMTFVSITFFTDKKEFDV